MRNGRRITLNITNSLHKLRTDSGKTQQQTSEELEIPRGTYATLESGSCLPTIDMLQDLMKVFKCEADELYATHIVELVTVESKWD